MQRDRVQIDPEASQWPTLLGERFERLTPEAQRFRAELGLPTDRPVILTGHQPEWWHPGIVAKLLAAQATADAGRAAWSWVVVAHDVVDPFRFDMPTRDHAGRLVAHTHRLAPPPSEGRIASSLAATRAEDDASTLTPLAEHSVSAVRSAFDQHAGAPNAVAQWIGTQRALLEPHVRAPEPIWTTDLLLTEAGSRFVDRLADDALAAATAYNRAAATDPGVGIPPLHLGVDPGAIELPLWYEREDHLRGRVFLGDLHGLPRERLLPRALVMTGLLRTLGCELFIHGRGGTRYDRVTERWLQDWLGVSLAPIATVSADLYLPLDVEPVSENAQHAAAWRAHHARHTPAELGDQEAQAHKDEALRAIKAGDTAAFRRMHRDLEQWRAIRHDELAALSRRVDELRARKREHVVSSRRDWPWPLYPADQRDALVQSITAAFTSTENTGHKPGDR